ncbi:MAG: ferredoxin [Candidatus Nanoarchaeia archaeon]
MTKIIHYREGCIGCNICVEIAPKFWTMNQEDYKSTLIKSKQKNDIFILDINEEDVLENEEAAQGCPTKVIKIQKE